MKCRCHRTLTRNLRSDREMARRMLEFRYPMKHAREPMDAEQNNPQDHPNALSSAEYRARLLAKLNCLVAVLEVAIAKISKSMDLPGANEERLVKIRSNLENTLSICQRAKNTLERGASAPGVRKRRTGIVRREPGKMSARDYVELSSIEEYQKFKSLPPIEKKEIAALDVETLMRRLTES